MNELLPAQPLVAGYPHVLPRVWQGVERSWARVGALIGTAPWAFFLREVERAGDGKRLARAVNEAHGRIWKMAAQEQGAQRLALVDALERHVLEGANEELRLAAAGWLRFFAQSGLLADPGPVFVTLVTAATREGVEAAEQLAYVKLVFQCFWPFRYPYAAYTWEVFPANEVFYPLAGLMGKAGRAATEELLGIFAELPTLEDEIFGERVLPVALEWAGAEESERRRRSARALALFPQREAREALKRLLGDCEPVVCASARRALELARKE